MKHFLLLRSIALIFGVVIFSCGITCLIMAWNNPNQAAPNGNTEPPLNISSTDQSKAGSLSVGGGLDYWITKNGDSFALKNNSDIENFVLGQNGFAGIALGPLSPDATAKLDLNGQIRIRGGAPGAGKVLTSDTNGLASWNTLAGSLPVGTSGQTLRHDGTNWIGNNAIFNNGTNVGIGTASPGAKLDISGQIKISGGSPGAGKVLTSDASGLASWATPTGSAMPAGSSGQTLRHDGTNWIGNSLLCNDGTNIGVGTCSPGSKLEIVGQVKITGGSPGSNKILASDASGLASWKTATDLGIALPAGTSGQTLRHDGTNWIGNNAIFNNGTNVGIGTASPGAKLDINGQIKISGGSPGAGKVLTSDASGLANWQTPAVGGSGTITGSGTTNYLSKFTSGTAIGNSQIFDDGTNVGIGTASPGTKLEVAGQVKITGGAPGAGKVLTSDASGLASWQSSTGGTPTIRHGWGYKYGVSGNYSWNVTVNYGVTFSSPPYFEMNYAGRSATAPTSVTDCATRQYINTDAETPYSFSIGTTSATTWLSSGQYPVYVCYVWVAIGEI